MSITSVRLSLKIIHRVEGLGLINQINKIKNHERKPEGSARAPGQISKLRKTQNNFKGKVRLGSVVLYIKYTIKIVLE